MTDEKVIERKLMFEGEGIGDDTRINIFQKQVIEWMNTNYDSQQENEAAYNEILLTLDGIENSRRKSELVRKREEKELEQYRLYYKEMKEKIANINQSIIDSKTLLSEAPKGNEVKLRYDMLVGDILAQPSRQESSKRVLELEENISKMKILKSKLINDWKRSLRRIHIIAHTSDSLNEMLDKEI